MIELHRLGAGPAPFMLNPDLIVTVGGDGTLLRGVRVAAPIGGLVLGVNVGRVGFLTEVGPDDLIAALDAVHSGRYSVDARLTLTSTRRTRIWSSGSSRPQHPTGIGLPTSLPRDTPAA